MADHYEVLGIGRNATPEDVKAAYRQIALRDHPDKNPGNSAAAARFRDAAAAYQVLIDPVKRAAYDRAQVALTWDPGSIFKFTERKAEYSYVLPLTVEEVVVGCSKQVQIGAGSYDLRVPPGTTPGMRVTLSGKTWVAHFNIALIKDPRYELTGPTEHDILVRDEVPYHVLVAGGTVNVKVPGGTREVRVPPLSPSGFQRVFPKEGCPWAFTRRIPGDLVIKLDVAVRQHSHEQLRLLAEYANSFQPFPKNKKRRHRF